MTLPALFAIGLGLTLTIYAIFAGADLGAGVLDVAARRSPQQRAALAHTIGPLWEANHVWLIFSITILFSAFPRGFAALGTVTLVPLTIAVMALVVRGVAFGLRPDPAGSAHGDRVLGRAFGAASIAAPFMFGASAAAVAQASASPRTAATPLSVPWTGVFAVSVGLLALGLCAYLAAAFVASRLQAAGDADLAGRFRHRAVQSGASVLALGGLSLIAAAWKAPALWHRLSTASLPLLAIGLLACLTSLYGLVRRRYRLARVTTMLTVAAVVWGWLIAQSPRLVGSRLTIHVAAATHPALMALAISVGVVLIAVVPAFLLLYALFRRPVAEVIQ